MKKLANIASKYEVEIFVAMVVATWILGAYGFIVALGKSGTGHDWLDALYSSLQLFFINFGGADFKQMSLAFEIARWLAPLLLAIASVRAIFAFAKDKLDIFKLKFASKHAVVCGLGQKGENFVHDYLKHHTPDKLVVIEKEPTNQYVEEVRNKGVIVLIGDARDATLLEKANLRKASLLVTFAGDDKNNLEITQQAYEIVNKDESPFSLECFVHIYADQMRRLLYAHEMFGQSSHHISTRLFSLYETGARKLLQEHFAVHQISLVRNASHVEQHHVLLLGFGWMGKELAIQAARIGCYPDGRRLRVTVLDRRAEYLARKLNQEVPCISQLLEIRFYAIDVDLLPSSIQSLNDLPFYVPGVDGAQQPASDIPRCNVAFVNLGDEINSYVAARNLASWFAGCAPPLDIVVCVNDSYGVSRLVGGDSIKVLDVNVRLYRILDKTCTFHGIVNRDLEKLARTIHYDYVRKELEKIDKQLLLKKCQGLSINAEESWHTLEELLGNYESEIQNERAASKRLSTFAKIKENSSISSWRSLPQDLKQANREQAEHIAVKLGIINCEIRDKKSTGQQSYTMSSEEVDLLARVEHARWMADKMLQGWQYGIKRDIQLKTNPLLISYDKLPKVEQDKDIDAVLNIPKLLDLRSQIIKFIGHKFAAGVG